MSVSDNKREHAVVLASESCPGTGCRLIEPGRPAATIQSARRLCEDTLARVPEFATLHEPSTRFATPKFVTAGRSERVLRDRRRHLC